MEFILTTWSDSDSPWNESEDEETTNLFLMTRESLGGNDESEDVTLQYLLTFSKEYLTRGLLNCIEF